MILLTGNIGALISGVVIMATLIVLPVAIISWLIIGKTKFYKEQYQTTTALNKIFFVVGLLAMIVIVFILVGLSIFKLIIS